MRFFRQCRHDLDVHDFARQRLPVDFLQRDRDLDAHRRQIVAVAPLAFGAEARRQPAQLAGDFQHPGDVRQVGIDLVFSM